jgi:hypothetical protein
VELAERVAAIVGQRVVALDAIPGAGGYTPALRLCATFADGSTAFVKSAVDDATAEWVAAERRAYEALGARSFLPGFLGADDTVLVLEDLRHHRWPPPWGRGDIDAVVAVLDELAGIPAPPWAPELNDVRDDLRGLWERVVANPAALLGLGVCSEAWLHQAAPVLVDACRNAPLEGTSIVHHDLRSDNVCLGDGGAVLIDWNLLCRGNGAVDLAYFAQTLTLEGCGDPWDIAPDVDPRLIAVVAGFFADRAPGPPLPHAPRVRAVQLAQLRVSLPWAARVLGLPPPGGVRQPR